MNADTLLNELASLHEESWGWVRGCCGGQAAEAEDVLQAAYGKAASGRLHHTPGASSLRTWWFGVLRITALEHRRQAARRSGLGTLAREHWQEWFGTPTAPAFPVDEAGTLRAVLATLPRRQQEVLQLVFYHDLTLDQAAAVMGVGLGSARTHYARAKDRMRTLLAANPHFSHEPAH